MGQRKTPEERLAELEKRREQLDARIRDEKAKAKTAERKRETRRKIIVGALALEHAQNIPAFRHELARVIRKSVTRADDRELLADLIEEKPESQ